MDQQPDPLSFSASAAGKTLAGKFAAGKIAGKFQATGPENLPADRRLKQGGQLFLLSLIVFFLCSILFYAIYASARRGDPQNLTLLPKGFLISTACLILISVLVHVATRTIRRERQRLTGWLLGTSAAAGILFTVMQCLTMLKMLLGPDMYTGTSRGLFGMVIVLAILHALHVLGGIIALGIVATGAFQERYDHERHWPVDFAAQYWHFLDVVWLCMLLTFWWTTGGFGF
ncbi:cytochrome c oxidase subunit 3 [Stieleria varia]|uniref:Cytochrome o ubiquinol oxidase subunit III n=1 Tax=Stieleria varia TaxID=2528005 RepID=A0A5C6B1N7_9BACT|nr:cytochrome c oxidase subunit 3 [Stieleria varia]TWU06043.1 cytochrome o ubiquinol oxidase subunit III [Stieleria varia]